MPFLKRHTPIFLVLLFFGSLLRAQTRPYLERPVTLHSSNRSLSELFQLISEQTGVTFSYSQRFNDKQRRSLHCTKRPLRLVLQDLLAETGCTYKLKEQYVIVKCDGKAPPPPSIITGYIYDIEDSSAVADASIYVKQTRHSAQSNAYGFFSLSYSPQLPSVSVSFARENYYDSTLVIYNKQRQEVIVYLYPRFRQSDTVMQTIIVPQKDSVFVITKKDSILVPQRRFFSDFWKPLKAFNTNLKNISDTLFSEVAISLVPYMSTNRLLSINTVNKVSFNVLAGYSKGVRGCEIGGLLNIDNGDVYYSQIAGLANVVSGESKGAQIAGILNFNDRSTIGAQLAGVVNVDRGDVRGAQIAGILNLNRGTTRGAQIAGISNIDRGSMNGIQVAGIGNISQQQIHGLQLGGVFNVSRHQDDGVQLAGMVNLADTLSGFQLAGIMNRAKYLRGVQLGICNFADSSSGVSIGFFNYIRKGYRKLEIGTDELLFGYASFVSGTHLLYSIFSAGINYSNTAVVTYGYGMGTSLTIRKRLGFCATLSAHQIQETTDAIFRNNILAKAYAGLEYRTVPKLTIGIGPTVNLFNTDANGKSDLLSTLPAHRLGESTPASSVKMWVGARLYLKFF